MINVHEQIPSATGKVQSIVQLQRALHFVWQSAKGWTVASGILVVVQGVLPLLPLYLMKLVVDATTAGLATPDKGAVFRQVLLLVALMGAATLAIALCNSISGLVGEAQSLAVTDHMNDVLHAKSVDVDLEYYESSRYHDTLHRAQQEAPYRPTRLVNGLVQVGRNGISLLALTGLLFLFHWFVAVIVFLAVLPGVAVRLGYAGVIYRWQRQQTSTERQAGYLNRMLTGSSHAKEIRLYDLGPLLMCRFRDLRRKLRGERLGIATRRSIAEFGAQTGATVAIYGSLAFVSYQTVQGTNTLGDLVMCYQALQRGQGFLQGLLGGLAGLYEDNLFLSNLYEFLDLKRRIVEPDPAFPVPRPIQTGIVVDHVSFNYPTSGRKVLEDVSLVIRPGEVVALVGENGSGKTTLVKLLCRLYEPTGGTITLDGMDLCRFETAALRREVSVLFQDYVQYHLTARENIWFGNIDLPPDHKRVVAAARDAGVDDVICRLPKGYETILGKQFDEGEELSIGEWQKVALSRTFLSDAQIIVLDEPTSSMDAKTEQAVFQNFRKLASGRTAILISHRFSTVRMADSIYVLQNGRIIEGGTHDELIRRGGTYAHLFEIQARQYR
jgi:ATP-binding cassette subfamily B protein